MGKDRGQEKGMTEGGMVVFGITSSMGMSLSKLRVLLMDREAGKLQSMGSQGVGHDRAIELK